MLAFKVNDSYALILFRTWLFGINFELVEFELDLPNLLELY